MSENFKLDAKRYGDGVEWSLTVLNPELMVDRCHSCGKRIGIEKIYFCRERERVYCRNCEIGKILPCQKGSQLAGKGRHDHFFVTITPKV